MYKYAMRGINMQMNCCSYVAVSVAEWVFSLKNVAVCVALNIKKMCRKCYGELNFITEK